MTSQNYKFVLVGNGGVGKTTYLKYMRSEFFDPKYIATLGVEVHSLHFNTNYGHITISVWDTAGREEFGGLRSGYYVGAHGAMIFYDHYEGTKANLGKWAYDIAQTTGDLPAVIVRTKSDKEGDVLPNTIPISIKNKDNLNEPFVTLMRRISGHEDLELLDLEPSALENNINDLMILDA